MALEVVAHRTRPIPASAVRDLYNQEGWWPERNDGKLAEVIANGPAVGAWDGDQLIGFARAVTDGHFRAYVEDVVVDAAHRRTGCGAALVAALGAELEGVDLVTLFCHRDHTSFYERGGFKFTRQQVGHRRST